MAKFKVTIKETLSLTVEMEAETFDEALNNVIDEYHAGKHVLTADNYVDTDFSATEVNGAYAVYKHYREGMDLVLETSDLDFALASCTEDDSLCSENGHALSIHNREGSIFEINYYGSKEINVGGCATEEELKKIKAFIEKNF